MRLVGHSALSVTVELNKLENIKSALRDNLKKNSDKGHTGFQTKGPTRTVADMHTN